MESLDFNYLNIHLWLEPTLGSCKRWVDFENKSFGQMANKEEPKPPSIKKKKKDFLICCKMQLGPVDLRPFGMFRGLLPRRNISLPHIYLSIFLSFNMLLVVD